MSLNVIVGAVIALVILVAVLFVFTDIFGGASRDISACETRNGVCVNEGACQTRVISGDCPENEECCFDTCVGGEMQKDGSCETTDDD